MATTNFDPIERDEPLPSSVLRKRRSGLGFFAMFVGGAAVVAVAVVGVLAYKAGERRGAEGVAPVIVAGAGPDKVRPDQPGGMEVPNQDKQIYERLGPARGQAPQPVERLLPQPEAPMAPPRPPARVEHIPPLTAPPPAPQIATAPELMKPREGVDAQPPAQPPAATVTTPSREVAKAIATAPAAGGTGAYRVQIAALRTPEDARVAIDRIKKSNGDILGSLALDVKRADLGDKGVYYRVQAGPLADAAAATSLCDRLKDRKLGCVVVRP